MRRIAIDIAGANTTDRERSRSYTVRPVRFPDGMVRMIQAQSTLWEALDQIRSDLNFTEEEFAICVYRHALADSEKYRTSLEGEIQWCWTDKAREFWRLQLAERSDGAANR